MGCCSKEKKPKDRTKKTTKKKKKHQLDEKAKKTVKEKKKVQEPPLTIKVEQPLVQAAVSTIVETKATKRRSLTIPSPNDDAFETFIQQRSPDDNIQAIGTLADLQRAVKQKEKPVSIVLFYARYCPYSKRTMPDLRQWARANKDRIVLYEADVEPASNLAQHYHVRTVPTLMAFDEQNLLAPIWQRTANQVLATEFETPPEEPAEIVEKTIDPAQFEEIFRTKFHRSNNLLLLLVDPSLKGFDRVLKVNETPNEHQEEQYLVILDRREATSLESKFLIAITNERGLTEVVASVDDESQMRSKSKSIASSQKSPYIWNLSTEKTSEQSSTQQIIEDLNPESEYQGRMISHSALSTVADGDCAHRSFASPMVSDDYGQEIHLPGCNELFYEKHYPESPLPLNHSPSFDRLSTLTYEHVKDASNVSGRIDSTDHQPEEVCVLYLGPNRRRGFEENQPEENQLEENPSKFSLLTLKSHSFGE